MSELAKIVLTAGAGLLTGALLAVLGTRQRLEVEYDIELRRQRIEAYQALWKILEPLAYYAPPSAVTYSVARDRRRLYGSGTSRLAGCSSRRRAVRRTSTCRKGSEA